MSLRPLLFALPAALLLCAGGTAHAQIDSREGIALQNQILELRRDVQALQDQVARGGGAAAAPRSAPVASGGGSDLAAQLLSRVNTLEEEVRQLRGRQDELANNQQVQNAALSKQIGDLAFQMQQGPGARPAGSVGVPLPAAVPGPTALVPPSGALATAPAVPPAATQVAVRRTPEMAIQDGEAALARRDYPTAEEMARDVLNNSRTSPRAYDAQYLLAEALSGKRDYSQAAIAYDDAYRRAPKGAHAPDALLGLANSLANINEKRAACDTLAQLHTEFPNPRPDLRDAAASLHQRAGCK